MHILNIEKQKEELYPIFKKIQEGNTILFLGAGASVGEKRFLSKELISFYEEKINKRLEEENITKWIDILSADPSFSRSHFDHFVNDVLKKLMLTQAHLIMATIPWREIITTNYDLLVEQAYDEVANSSSKLFDIKPIRNVQQYSYRESNTEVKYIKLNGCIQDKSLYPLAFSSDDFDKLKSFYKVVLNDLKNLSSEISFISIGYSYSDDFGKELLSKFDSYNYRDKKWMINIDPYPNLGALPYYDQKKIQIIKCSFSEFFLMYKEWDETNVSITVKKKGLHLRTSNDSQINISNKLLLNLDGLIRQLNIHTKDNYFIKDDEFYRGEEPTFNLITRNVDVIKNKYLEDFQNKIKSTILQGETFLPIFFILGDFGIGKSTFTLRLIYEMEKQLDFDLIAFEILDFNRMRKEYIIDLIKSCGSKNIVFFCDEIEVESVFKGLIDLRYDLSIEQFQDCNVFFVAPIRENIYEKYKLTRVIPQAFELNIKGTFQQEEIDELLDKLKNVGLVEFRDASEKIKLRDRITKEYNADSFISLMSIVSSGKHEADLIHSYNQLSKEAQQAFLYTALLHKFKLSMPASWLKQNISMDWDEFTTKIVKAEGKGILIQEIRSSYGTQPDLYFKTKHPIIAEKLVNKFLPSRDKQFEFYDRMLRAVESSMTNSYLVNNLLKTFIRNSVFNKTQIDKLFTAANTKLSDEPHFLLNYAINLQQNRTKDSLKKAIDILLYAESLLENRNHKFIHRRAVLNFELAKLYHEEEDYTHTSYYLGEAKELFNTKQLLDPCSSYSYVDYIKSLIWELDNCDFDEEDRMRLQIRIEGLFEYANSTVTIEINRIDSLYADYSQYLNKVSDNYDYERHLYDLYSNDRLRPYACILLYSYHYKKEEYNKCIELVDEMEGYSENYEIVKFLFNYYGEFLFDPNIRIKLLRLARENKELETDMPFRFNFFIFIAEFYNNNYNEGGPYLDRLRTRYSLNPSFHYVWCDSDGQEKVFEAFIRQRGKFKDIKISSIQLSVRLLKGNYDNYSIGERVKVKLHFFLHGLFAEIIDLNDIDV